MPFRVQYRGMEIICDTVEDVAAIAERFGGTGGNESGGAGSGGSGNVPDGRWTVGRFRDFTGRLSAPQLKMLQELVRTPHGRTSKDLVPTLGFTSDKSFGPILAAMSKHAKKSGVAITDVLSSERIDVGSKDKVLEFKAAPSFLRTALQAGWKSE